MSNQAPTSAPKYACHTNTGKTHAVHFVHKPSPESATAYLRWIGVIDAPAKVIAIDACKCRACEKGQR